jgi:hypothetical protein
MKAMFFILHPSSLIPSYEFAMADNPRVQQLLDELASSDATPEEVCGSCPELLPMVRERWQQICRAQAELDAVFPPADQAETQAHTPLPVIPGYEIEDLLGRGGMGVVFRARHLRLNRVVALKMTLGGSYAGPRERSRFQREAEAVARLQHPNVVPIYDVGDSDGRAYFTMEYVAGGSLAQKLSGAPQPAREAAALIATLACAVHVAHGSEIVHRDLKPANVLLAADGTPKISDFGLARRLDGAAALTWSGTAVGTPSYMAPEQATGKPDAVGPAADIYSLGAILYEMLTGRPPFRAESAAATVEQVLTRDPVAPSRLNPTVPRDLETVCLKCLQKDPDKRYAAAAELAADLRRFQNHEPIQARPIGRLEKALRWARRRPAAAGLLAAVAMLALMAGVGGSLLYQQRAAARQRQAQTDRDVRGVLARAGGPLDAAWQAQDVAQLTAALAEGNRAVDVARSGGAGQAVQEEAEAFQADAGQRLARARKNRALMEAVLDVSVRQGPSVYAGNEAGRWTAPAEPSVDEQYAAAFRGWGLDVDAIAEDEATTRLLAEPQAVVQEVIAALGGWMLERRRQNRPEAEWRRLFRVAERLDGSERHRRLRALLIGESPPRAESVMSFVGSGSPWLLLWELSRGDRWRQLRQVREDVNPRTDPVLTVILLAQAYGAVGDTGGAEQLLAEAATTRPDQAALLDALGKLQMGLEPSRGAKAVEYYRAVRALRPRLGIALSGALIRAARAEEAEGVLRDMLRQGSETPEL